MKKIVSLIFSSLLMCSCNNFSEYLAGESRLRDIYENKHEAVEEVYGNFDPLVKGCYFYNEYDFISFSEFGSYNINYNNIICIKKNESYKPIMYEFDNEEEAKTTAEFMNKAIDSVYFYDENIIYNDYFASYVLFGDTKIVNDHILSSDGKYYLTSISTEEILYLPSVIEIKSNAFEAHSNIKEIICNEELERINNIAFAACPSLEKVLLNSTLKYIGKKAFILCPNLTYIVVPESVEYIGEEAFDKGIVYCEAKSKPENWNKNFANPNVKVYWKDQWEYNEFGNPSPKRSM